MRRRGLSDRYSEQKRDREEDRGVVCEWLVVCFEL